MKIHKNARLTVNLEDQACSALQTIADHEDAPAARVARRVMMDFIAHEETRLRQPVLPLIGSTLR